VEGWVTARTRRPRRRGLWMASLVALGGASVSASGDVPPSAPRAIEMLASRFQFEPATLQVAEGDRVRLTLRSTDTDHGFAIGKLNVKVAVPKGGEPVTVEFVADRAGTYEFKCSEYCGSGHGRMKGQLVVTPRAQ
jgi:heme/copper-type cytochrome/quinol oxidase subunit 2